MTGSIGRFRVRALVLVALGVATSLAADHVAYRRQSTIRIEFDEDPPASIARGFYEAERAPDGLTFAWTGPVFGLTLHGLDRRVPWTVTMRMRGARPDRSAPEIRAVIDGAAVPSRALSPDFSEYAFNLPATGARDDAHLNAAVAPTVVAGPTDPRVLGAQVDWIRIAPVGEPRPPAAFESNAIPIVAVAAVLAWTGLPLAVSAAILALFAVVAAVVTTNDLAPVLGLAIWPLLLAGAAAAAGAAACATAGRRDRRGAELVGVATLVAVTLKLLVLFHPAMPIGDAMFQAHRFQDVLGGHYLFTSIAPGEYQFPYAIGLYLAARPFAAFTHTPLDRIALLRLVVVIVDGALAGCLYRFVAAWRRDGATAAATVGVYHLVPLGFNVIVTGNLTNAFSQSLAMPVLALVASSAVWRAAGVATLGFLSHTGTLAILSAQLVVTGVWLFSRRDGTTRRDGLTLIGATLGAIAIAFVVYYAHFFDVYRQALTRAMHETGEATSAGGRTPMTRLEDVPRMLVFCYGWPVLLLAAAGLAMVLRDRTDHGYARTVLLAWLLACGLFVVLGIVTPIDFRHYLAAVPLVAILVALALTTLWRGGTWLRVVTCLFAGWIAWVGILDWLAPIVR